MEAKIAELNLTPNITELPNEMLLKIFEYLPQSAHYAVGLVSNYFQNLIDDIKEVLEITENNVRKVKKSIENKTHKLCFKHVKIDDVSNIKDLEYILQSIGKEIEYISMKKTAAFHLLKDNVKYLKSLEINFDYNFRNHVDDGSFNLQYFPLLEELIFNNSDVSMNSTTNKMLEQLKSPENISSLKHFKLFCNEKTEDRLIDSLLHHSSTLESLELEMICSLFQNFNKWVNPFSRIKNLMKLCLTGSFIPEMLNIIFSALAKETPLEHLQLDVFDYSDYNGIFPLFVEKWMDTLQYLELNSFRELRDDIAKELGKLQKLRVFKNSHCRKFSKNCVLAEKQNNFMDELHLQYIWDLDDSDLGVMVSSFPNLRVLTLEQSITNTSLASICRYSTRLRSLSIDCSNITDEGMIGFGNEPYSINRLRHLVKLTLDNCESLTDRTLIEGFKLPALRSLEIGACPKITLKGIESLVKACPLLEFLSIPSTVFTNDNVNENALFVIEKGLKHLLLLKIIACDDLPYNVQDRIKDVFEKLRDTTTNTTFAFDCKLKFECFSSIF